MNVALIEVCVSASFSSGLAVIGGSFNLADSKRTV